MRVAVLPVHNAGVGTVLHHTASRDGYHDRVVTAPGEWTYLRIAARKISGVMRYTAYTSLDAVMWNHGGTWTHNLGNGARIGLVSMGGSGFTTQFDYVRVYTLDRTIDQP